MERESGSVAVDARSSRSPAPASPVRVGIVGAGFIGRVHARSARLAGARVVGVAASSAESAARAAAEIGAERAFASADDLVVSDEVDVVHVCAPNHLHLPLARAALEAGKHVVCEKPVALDSTGASRNGMLQIMPDAQGSGQKAQQDALLGQGSIFDLEETAPVGGLGGVGPSPFAGPQHPAVPAVPDDRSERGAMEKETLGLFLSSHPLKEVRAALRLRVECSLAELDKKKDGEWVTVGGTITESKKIRTKKGDPMMFATLDDLEGSVEMLVFNSAYAANVDKIDEAAHRVDVATQKSRTKRRE